MITPQNCPDCGNKPDSMIGGNLYCANTACRNNACLPVEAWNKLEPHYTARELVFRAEIERLRDQLERAENTNRDLNVEIGALLEEREWRDARTAPPSEVETVQILFGGKTHVGYWQEQGEGDFETGIRKYRAWYYMQEGDDQFVHLDGEPDGWQPLASPPNKEPAP